jgi:hypothetical protein
MQNTVSFIKTDDNFIINQTAIRWVKKMNECLEVCSKQDGCLLEKETRKICKVNSLDSYNKLNEYFK